MKKIYFSLVLCFFVITGLAQKPVNWPAGKVILELQKLKVFGSVLYIAAHPDDENTRLLAYLANEKKMRTGYLSLTRGDGGQNLIGDEMGISLGLIRTQELLSARRIDGAEQFFTRAYDFGYSKTPVETLQKWDHDKILSDVVWVIRKFQPDIIITRFPTTGEGGHGHVAGDAVGGVGARRVAGMGGRVEAFGQMALPTHRRSRRTQFRGMGRVAVGTGHALRIHQALLEGVIVEHLVPHHAIRLEQPFGEEGGQMGVGERPAGMPVLREDAPPGMAAGAGFDLVARWPGNTGLRASGRGIDLPVRDGARGGNGCEPPVRGGGIARALRPVDMPARRSVAGLAADADLGKAGIETIRGRVIILAQRGGMALRAHEVPVLLRARPVQRIGGRDHLVRIEVEPALAALARRADVIGEGQGLFAAIGKADQILLERFETEGIRDFEGRCLSVRPLGLDHVARAVAIEAGG